jgi:hypothetical protein
MTMSESVVTAYAVRDRKQQNCWRFGYNLRMMAKHVDILHGVTLKRTVKPTESGSTQQHKKKCWKHVRFLQLGPRFTASRLLKETFKVSALSVLADLT